MTDFQNFKPTNQQESLGLEIAQNLCDINNLPLYLAYCQKYPTEIIFKAYGQAKEMPADKIKKSRGALFTYLVKFYAQNQKFT